MEEDYILKLQKKRRCTVLANIHIYIADVSHCLASLYQLQRMLQKHTTKCIFQHAYNSSLLLCSAEEFEGALYCYTVSCPYIRLLGEPEGSF